MFAQFYQNGVLKNPKTVFILLVIAILSFGYYSKDFKIAITSKTNTVFEFLRTLF